MRLRDLIATVPKSNRLAYYSFIFRRGLRGDVEIEEDVEVEYRGTRFLVPKQSREVFYSVYLEDSEPLTYKLMTSLGGGTFVDVGANFGGYTVRLARKFRDVISIEPNPKAANGLRTNVELNGLSNVRIVQEAISDTTGETLMSVPGGGHKTTRSSIVEKFGSGSSFAVHTTTLDTLLSGLDAIDLVKIDVEGAEISVLKGAAETLQKTSRVVLETGPWSEPEIREILKQYSFEISDLDMKAKEGKNVTAVRPSSTR